MSYNDDLQAVYDHGDLYQLSRVPVINRTGSTANIALRRSTTGFKPKSEGVGLLMADFTGARQSVYFEAG